MIPVKQLLQICLHQYPNYNYNYHRVAIAPMIDVSTIHFRFFMRLLTRCAVIYTEMIHSNAVTLSPRGYQSILRLNQIEHPVICQLGGNDPKKLAQAAKYCEIMGYDEVNLNVGCPSDRVQAGCFGAVLMKDAQLVGNIMKEMRAAVSIPCTVKCRLGVDEFDSYEFALEFVRRVSELSGVDHFIIHARKCLLKGLDPKQNRTIPPLKYEYVVRLKQDLPRLKFSINGGFRTVAQVEEILRPENGLHGCMIGRAAYETPWMWADFDRVFFGQPNPGYSRREIIRMWGEYGTRELLENPKQPLPPLIKPVLTLFVGEKHNKFFRGYLSDKSEFLRCADFQEYMEKAIKVYESCDPECKAVLDARMPSN